MPSSAKMDDGCPCFQPNACNGKIDRVTRKQAVIAE